MTTLVFEDLHSSEKVVDFAAMRAARGLRPPLTTEELIKTAVARRLGGVARLPEAQARAVGNYHRGLSSEESIRRACAWATSAIDPNGPRAA